MDHNGLLREFAAVRRDLSFAVDPSLYAEIEGSTDSELFFYLALTFGLEDDPPTAVELWPRPTVPACGRFATRAKGSSRSLFYSTAVETLRAQYPDNPTLHGLSDESRLVDSEPLGDLAGAWNEVPESTWGIVQEGQDELHPFTPRSA